MKKYYKHSLTAFVIGMILGIAVSFVSITVAWIVIGVSILQMFIFYRCPHCNYGLYNVSLAYRVAVLIVAKIYKVSGGKSITPANFITVYPFI